MNPDTKYEVQRAKVSPQNGRTPATTAPRSAANRGGGRRVRRATRIARRSVGTFAPSSIPRRQNTLKIQIRRDAVPTASPPPATRCGSRRRTALALGEDARMAPGDVVSLRVAPKARGWPRFADGTDDVSRARHVGGGTPARRDSALPHRGGRRASFATRTAAPGPNVPSHQHRAFRRESDARWTPIDAYRLTVSTGATIDADGGDARAKRHGVHCDEDADEARHARGGGEDGDARVPKGRGRRGAGRRRRRRRRTPRRQN